MNNDDLFLNSLADFKDLKSIRGENEFSIFPSQIPSNAPELELDLLNNEKIMRNFKELRQQLKQSTGLCQKLRQKVLQKQRENERLATSQKDYITQNYQLKNDLQHSQELCNDLKKKLQYLKENCKGVSKMQDELEYLKIEIIQYQKKLETATLENKKMMEVSVLEKIQLEEKINKFIAKQNSDLQYIQDMEVQLSKNKEKCLKLENQLRKVEILYDEEVYNKKWVNGNYEKQYLQEQMQKLEKQNEEMIGKQKKEKERRSILEKRVLELEEMTGLWTVKAEAYQIENKNLNKKFKKMEKKIQIYKENSEQQIAESLSWQQKFLKSLAISEELISRVKRQIYGEIVSLAKTCQFKLNKLKDQQKPSKSPVKIVDVKKSPSISKKRSKSRTCSKIVKNSETPQRKNLNEQNEKIEDIENLRTKLKFDNEERTRKFSQTTRTEQKRRINFKQDEKYFEQSAVAPLSQIQNLDTKIRRQREAMEKKIRQKMLYRKIQVSNSPEKHGLREEYLQLVNHL